MELEPVLLILCYGRWSGTIVGPVLISTQYCRPLNLFSSPFFLVVVPLKFHRISECPLLQQHRLNLKGLGIIPLSGKSIFFSRSCLYSLQDFWNLQQFCQYHHACSRSGHFKQAQGSRGSPPQEPDFFSFWPHWRMLGELDLPSLLIFLFSLI